ncbi:MAG: acetyl-CoA carboxylase biotin carboxyl carrier protein subunit [Clostridia bacterium]|nr:acetyl-CoA carboxylase biotin carboxyl carrier protein subunit [Clostridia bacterium]
MRKFSVKVNGVAYDVEIEELDATVSSAPAVTSAPVAPAAAPAAPAVTGNRGAEIVKAPIQGTLVKILAKAGTKVAKGECVCILEAMKMENEIVAPIDGVIATVEASQGAAVEEGSVLFTMN